VTINSVSRPAGQPTLGLSRYQWLLLVTCLATFALIVIGGIVRTTGSGDACPDWPRCHGQLIPPLETDVLIEFSHRLSASVVGFLVLGVAIAGWRSQRDPLVRWGGWLAVGLVVAQIILGGATVLSELSANVVTAHLALATTLFATLIVLAVRSIASARAPADRVDRNFQMLSLVVALSAFVVMMTGSYVSGSGAALVFRDWPLFDGSVLPGVARLEVIHATHRFAVLALGVLLGYLAHRAWALDLKSPVLKVGPFVAFVLYIAQALVGAANIWTLVQPSAAAAHVALAELLWATLVTIAGLACLRGATVSSPAVERHSASRPAVGATAPAGEVS
jgi:heme A synthase